MTAMSAAAFAKLHAGPPSKKFGQIRFGICTDLHQDIMHDAPARLSEFIAEMNKVQPGFIIQLGDFCRPVPKNQVIMDIWNKFNGPRYHVIGNHDTDGGFNASDTLNFWQASARYYSFDANGFHFVILDGNEKNPSPSRAPGYARFISDEQLKWLMADLEKTSFPAIVFCHQGLDNDIGGIENATKCRTTLERINESAGFRKVQIVFSGHRHQDYHNVINGIHYVQVNSMSYYWLGEGYQHTRYNADIDKTHPQIKNTAPYTDALWALVEIDSRGLCKIIGRRSSFVGPSPVQLGMPEFALGYPVVPYVSNRKILLTKKPFEYTGNYTSSNI